MARDHNLLLFALHLRQESTDAENLLWSRLRRSSLEGVKFKRQQPVGPYIVDFVALRKRLIVEVDGGQHDEPSMEEKDRQRTEWLEARGYRVLRFWDNEALTNIDGVLEVIRQNLIDDESAPSL